MSGCPSPHRVALATLIASTVVTLSAPLRAEPQESLLVARWGVDDGLPQSSVTDMVQTRDGYLWVATFGGLARFDGLRFVVYDMANTPSLVGNRFLALHEAPSGDLWIGCEEGGALRHRAGHFTHIPVVDAAGTALPVGEIATDRDGVVWLATRAGAFRVIDDHAEPVALTSGGRPVAPPITGFAFGPDTGWVQTLTTAACVSGRCPSGPADPTDGLINDVAIGGFGAFDTSGRTYFAGTHALRSFGPWGAGARLELTVTPEEKSYIRAVVVDPFRGDVWFGVGRQLWRRAPGGPWVDVAPKLGGLLDDPRDTIRALLVDREGTLWIGTDRRGLSQVRLIATTRFGLGEGLGRSMFSVLEDRQGRVWATGSCAGPFVSADGEARFDLHPITDGAIACAGALALGPDGAVWVGDGGAVRRIGDDGDKRLPFPHIPPQGAKVLSIAFDRDQHVWVGTDDAGLHELAPDGRPIKVYGPAEGLDRVAIAHLGPTPDGGLWIGTTQGAVRMHPDRRFERIPELARGAVRDILVGADGAVWLGTYGGGLTRWQDGRAFTFSTAQGLCDNTVSRLLDDGRGHLWTNGNRGVARVPWSDLIEVARGDRVEVRCTRFDTGEGNGGMQPSGWRARDGRFWFPTVDGLIAVDPTRGDVVSVPPLVAFESVTVDGVPVGLDALGERPAGRGDVAFRYTALAFDAPRQVRFRHRLLGLGEGWTDAGSDRSVSYTNLAPGDYVFEVKAAGLRGLWSEPARIAMTLAPHFWQTVWFNVSVAALGVVLVWGAMVLRMRAVRRRNRMLRDEVRERQRTEAEVREQKRHYRTLFDGANNGLFLHAADGRLVEANAAGGALVGVDPEALQACGVQERLTPEHRAPYRELIARTAAGQSVSPIDVVLEGPAGARVEARCSATRFDRGGEPHALVTAVDLTAVRRAEAERRELEQRLQQGHRLEALGLLASGIAHDFNNHLTAIGTSTALVRERTTSDEVHTYAADITASVQRAGDLVRRLLAFGRQQPGTTSDIDPAEAVSTFVPILTRLLPKDVAIAHSGPRGQGKIRVDPVLFEQCVMNLVLNARDAMPQGGQVAITTGRRAVPVDEATRYRVAPGDYRVVAVRDTGHGIDPVTLQRIFDPFFTTKDVGKGTGLGLTITHATLENAGGFIRVSSEPGRGATFELCFPALPEAPVTAPPPDEPPVPESVRSARRVLLCDDDEFVRRSTRRMLELRGFEVVEFDEPERALARFTDHPERIDLVLTDVVLPTFSGPELARRMRAIRPELPVVLMSGHTRDVDIDVPGDLPFVSKPFTVDRLATAITTELTAAYKRRSDPALVPPPGALQGNPDG